MSKKKKIKASDCQCCVCGQPAVAFWNGLYWVGRHGIRIMDELYRPVRFYIFDYIHHKSHKHE